MACFTVPALIHALIWLAIIGFIVFVVRLIIPIIMGWFGLAGGIVDQILRALLVLIAIILVLLFLLWVYECSGGFRLGMLLLGAIGYG